MSEFLDRILATKYEEVAVLKEVADLNRQQVRTTPACFKRSIQAGDVLAIVAEAKKASPSKGVIQPNFNAVSIAQKYEQLGASAVSVLTDKDYFQGSIDYLEAVVANTNLPALRKDFIIDETQINEAVLAGADAVLLICAALQPERLRQLAAYAKECGLDVLIEIHSLEELDAALKAGPSVLGINNRNLKTFEVDLAITEVIMPHVDTSVPVISESGIGTAEDAQRMAATGVAGLLVGESLIRRAVTGTDLADLFHSIQRPRQGMIAARNARGL